MRLFGFDITRSKEARSNLAYPEGWLQSIFTLAGNNHSGVAVNEVTGLSLPSVYACIRILSETVAQLPLYLYEIQDNGKVRALGHPIDTLISRKPNEEMTSFVWRDTVQGHVGAWGNGYCYIQRNPMGRPVGLIPLLPDRTHVYRIDNKLVYYSATDPWQRGVPIPMENLVVKAMAEDVVHIPAFGYDGTMGYSPIRLHAEAVGLGLAAQQFGSAFFGSGATLDGVLEHPSRLSPDAAKSLQEQWDKSYHGIDKAHRTAVLWEGMKYNRIGIPPEEAQFVETRKLQRTEIASIYRIPPHMIGDLEKATFSNISEQSIEFLRYTMAPWLRRWEQELTAKLLSEEEQRRYVIEFDRASLLKGTPQEQSEALNTGIMGGWINRNEARESMGYNPVAGLDKFLQPLNMVSAGAEAETETEEALDNRAGVSSLLEPFIRRFAEQVANAEGKAKDDALAALIVRNLKPIVEACYPDDSESREQIVSRFADEYEKGADHAATLMRIIEELHDGH